MKKIIVAAILILTLLIISGCYKTKGPAAESDQGVAGDLIQINAFVFEPAGLEVKAGTMVTWKQNHEVVHTVVSPGLFESEVLNRGDTFTFTFSESGEYDYYCGIHPSMTGKVIVK